jgi:hypothetical protein
VEFKFVGDSRRHEDDIGELPWMLVKWQRHRRLGVVASSQWRVVQVVTRVTVRNLSAPIYFLLTVTETRRIIILLFLRLCFSTDIQQRFMKKQKQLSLS